MKNQWKGFLTGVLTTLLLFTLIGGAAATIAQREAVLYYNDVKIEVDGKPVTPKDEKGNVVEPFAVDGTNYLPIRAIANALGLDVEWVQETKTVKLTSKPAASNPGTNPSGGKMNGSGNLGDFHVEIKNAAVLKDYDRNPAIAITYSWTNNSNETTNAMVEFSEQAFQDGVELDRAMMIGSEQYEGGLSLKDLRPGATIDVQVAFELKNTTSPVEFELSELFSFSDDIVIKTFDLTKLP